MKSEAQRPVRTFVTFRITGDDLVPAQITKFLKLVPTQAYAKGERYTAGPRSQDLLGRTGMWYFSTDRVVASERLIDHLMFLLQALFGGSPVVPAAKIVQLKRLIERNSLHAVLTCFWDGPAGAKQPVMPRGVEDVFKLISAEIVTDFDTDEELPPKLTLAKA